MMDRGIYGKQIDQQIRLIGSVTIGLLYIMGIAVVVLAVIHRNQFDPYYRAWAREFSFYSFASSMQYFIAAIAAYGCYWIARLFSRVSDNRLRRSWLWLAASVGLIIATYDEFFMAHEKLLTRFDNTLPWLKHFYFNAADDLFLVACGIGALGFIGLMYKEIRVSPRAIRYYYLGTALLVFAGLLDFLPGKSFQLRLPLGLEELCEYFAGTSFSAAFALYGLERLKLVLHSSTVANNTEDYNQKPPSTLNATPAA